MNFSGIVIKHLLALGPGGGGGGVECWILDVGCWMLDVEGWGLECLTRPWKPPSGRVEWNNHSLPTGYTFSFPASLRPLVDLKRASM